MRIVPLALKNYFVYNIPVEDTIKQNRDIFNFCLRLKTNSKSTPFYKYLQNGRLQEKRLDRTTRYYISNSGGAIYKDFGEGRASGVNVGFSITLFNKFEDKEWDDYDINYNFYISEANKIKNPLVVKELDLFSF